MKYYLANNVTINKTESKLCFIQKYPGNIFCCDGNGRQDVLDTFISRNNLVEKTLQESQSLVNTAITQAQNNYDTLPESEKDLKNLFPQKNWNKLHLQMIFYGREFCKARECYGIVCKICKSCYPNRARPIKTIKA